MFGKVQIFSWPNDQRLSTAIQNFESAVGYLPATTKPDWQANSYRARLFEETQPNQQMPCYKKIFVCLNFKPSLALALAWVSLHTLYKKKPSPWLKQPHTITSCHPQTSFTVKMQLSDCVNNISAILNSWKTSGIGEIYILATANVLSFCFMAFFIK